jgi:hypothetical protein
VARRVPDPSVAHLAERLREKLEPLADEIVALIESEIPLYRTGSVVTRAQLRRSVLHNFTYMLGQLSRAEAPDLAPPRRTGHQRAEQGAPLPEVLRAYRLGFAFLWKRLLAEARRSGDNSVDALLDTSTEIWELADDYSLALVEAYREARAERMVSADRRRSALVAALIGGPAGERDTAWEVAKLLDFPYEGCFLVVVAETSAIGAEALPELEGRLGRMDVTSAWRYRPDYEVGVLSCGRRRPVDAIVEAVHDAVTVRAGISPAYTRLDQTPRAMRFAQVALESLPPGVTGVRQLDDTPLGELILTSLDTTRRMVHRVLGGVLALPEEDRSTLVTTAEAWLDARGSAAEAGRILSCHQNTVRYRMRRLEGYLAGSLDDPKTIAELTAALQAIRTFPVLAAAPTDPAAAIP